MKQRLDGLLVEKRLATGRDKAKAMIMAGLVYVGGKRADKPGETVDEGSEIEVRGGMKYVSRGGLKLEKALKVFPISPKGLICMDIGASTGGFTDCMLQNGAAKVYAIDVGYGQLAWSLRSDSRVVVLERKNFRYITQTDVPEEIDFAGADVSFISLRLIMPAARGLLKPGGVIVCLIKPQFEAGREKVGKKGVVRDKGVHLSVLTDITDFAVANGFSVLGLDYSPVRGPEGNIEYLMYAEKSDNPVNAVPDLIMRVAELSHEELTTQ